MKGVGLLVGTIFFLIICAVLYNNYGVKEGFQTRGPEPTKLVGPVPHKDLADLPSAAYSNMPDIPVPARDPTQAKSRFHELRRLKADMDAFQERLYPHMVEMADPTVQLPLMRFKGDYQSVKDEILVLAANPGLGVQLTEEQMEMMRANLRFLNKTYHTLEVNQLAPTNTVSEGFTDSDDSTDSPPITPEELSTLHTKLFVEIARLNASGTSDPIIQARINVFTKIQQSIADLLQRISDKRLDHTMIPIKKSDYNAFLPALGNNSVGIGGLLSSAGLGSLSSLFNSYDTGDISGSVLAANLMDRYAESILNGLSYNVSLSYTSPNELAKEMAKAASATATVFNPRGEFEELMTQMEVDGFSNSEEKGPAKFDWKERSQSICKAIGKLGLNPSDFGCMDPGAQVGPDYSWRGNARMVCTRAAAHSDPGIPEQVGCPPVSWKGWRN